MHERGPDQAADVDLVHPSRPGAGVQSGAFDESEGLGDRGVVGALDCGGGGRVGDRPQAGDALHRGEGQVEPGYRGRLLLGQFRDVAGQFTLVERVASVLVAEHLQRNLGPDPGPVLDRTRRPHRQPAGGVELFEAAGDLDPERAHIVGIDGERLPEPGRVQVVVLGGVGARQSGAALLGEGVEAGAEQGLHLFDGDDVARLQSVDAGQAGADPGAWGFALLRVVGREPGVSLLGGVHGGDLPGQVVIARPGRDPLHAHRHNPLSRIQGVDPDRSGQEVGVTSHPVRGFVLVALLTERYQLSVGVDPTTEGCSHRWHRHSLTPPDPLIVQIAEKCSELSVRADVSVVQRPAGGSGELHRQLDKIGDRLFAAAVCFSEEGKLVHRSDHAPVRGRRQPGLARGGNFSSRDRLGDLVGRQDGGKMVGKPAQQRCGWSQRHQHRKQRPFIHEERDLPRPPGQIGAVPVPEQRRGRRSQFRGRADSFEQLAGTAHDHHRPILPRRGCDRSCPVRRDSCPRSVAAGAMKLDRLARARGVSHMGSACSGGGTSSGGSMWPWSSWVVWKVVCGCCPDRGVVFGLVG